MVARLEDGLDQGWIPGWLEKAIKADTDTGFQRFKPAAFSKTATRDLLTLTSIRRPCRVRIHTEEGEEDI